jgi:hypothetical protein
MPVRTASLLAAVIIGLLSPGARAEQSATFGDYTVHYNALPTEVLEPSVAKLYDIRRSQSRALLNVAVLKKKMGLTGQPVRAEVKATATNLSAQLRNIEMRELNEQGAIYYIGELPVAHEETLKFTIEVTPDGETEPFVTRFDQQFFTR